MYNSGSGDWIGLQEAAKICSEVLGSEKSQDDVFKMGYIEYLNSSACLKIYSFPREGIVVEPYDQAAALALDDFPLLTQDDRSRAFRAYSPGDIFEVHPDILERLLSLRILPSDQWPYSVVIRATVTEELPGWEYVGRVDNGIEAHWSKTFDGAITPKIEIVWNDLRVDRQELLERLAEITQAEPVGLSWKLKSPKRYQGYGRPLFDFLKAAHAAQRPIPSAHDVLDSFKATLPPEVIEVMPDGLKYYDAEGKAKVAGRDAVKKAIDRLIGHAK